MSTALSRLRHAGAPLAALAALAGALVHRLIAGLPTGGLSAEAIAAGAGAAALMALLTVPVGAVVLIAVGVTLVAASVVAGLALTPLVALIGPAYLAPEFVLAAEIFFGVAFCLLLSGVTPVARLTTRHEIRIAAAPQAVFEALQPQPSGVYWKRSVRVRPAPGGEGALFDFYPVREDAEAEPHRVRMTVDEARRIVSFEILGAEEEGSPFRAREHYAVVDAPEGAQVGLLLELRRPSLGFLAAHALLDLSSDELRGLKRHFEGGAGPAFLDTT